MCARSRLIMGGGSLSGMVSTKILRGHTSISPETQLLFPLSGYLVTKVVPGTMEVHPIFSEAPHSERSILHPETDSSLNQFVSC